MRNAPTHGSRCVLLASAILALAFLAERPAPAAGSEPLTTVTVIGSAPVSEGGMTAAREKAIADSLTSAVQSVATGLLDEDGMVTHFPTLNQVLFDQPEQVVQEYRVLTEFQHGSTLRVLVVATIQVPKVVQQLASVGILNQNAFLPKILFLIAEQNPEGTPSRYWWSGDMTGLEMTTGASALTEALSAKGFAAVDHSQTQSSAQLGPVSGTPDLSNAQAADLGTQLGADIVVVGTAISRDAMNTMGEDKRTFKGVVSVRAIRVETGEEIAATEQTAIAVDTDAIAGGTAAIAAACKGAAEDLSGPVESAWQGSGVRPGILEMSVTGTNNLAGFVKLREMMSAAHGVNGIQVRSIGANQATIAVDYPGDADELAATLIGNDFESFGIHISEITTDRIEIEIVSPEAALTPETTD